VVSSPVADLAALVTCLRANRVTGVLTMDVPKIVGPELDLTGSPLAVSPRTCAASWRC
jgi:hypothetical protein